MNPGLIYTASGLDRQAMRRNDVNWLNAQENHADMRVVPVWRDKNLVDGMDTAPLPLVPSGAVGTRLLNAADTVLFLGLIDGSQCGGRCRGLRTPQDIQVRHHHTSDLECRV